MSRPSSPACFARISVAQVEITQTVTALLEVACWDIIGKALDQPVYKLLGGAVRHQIKGYATAGIQATDAG